MHLNEVKEAWKNAYYRVTLAYICVFVTLIFGFQVYQYFVSGSADECPDSQSAVSLIPVIGVLLDA